MFGMLNQDKMIPLRYCALTIELELVNNPSDAVYIAVATADLPLNFTSDWDITDIQCKCDSLHLDSSLENEYASHLLSGKTLPINFSTWNHTNQATNVDKDFSAHISRALIRLKSVCITLHKSDSAWYKECNNFYHPMGAHTTYETYIGSQEHQVWIQIGATQIPEYPINSVTEAYYRLRKVVGVPFQIIPRWYRSRRYITGVDCETNSGAGYTGLSIKNGDLLTVNFRNC